jgi:hypothetical protein
VEKYTEEELDILRGALREIVGDNYYKYLQFTHWIGRIVLLRYEYLKLHIDGNTSPQYSCDVFNSKIEELPLLMSKRLRGEVETKCYQAVISWRLRLGR